MRIIFAITLFSFNFISASELLISTSSGITDGYYKNKVINWDDIPYAQPPVDGLRWMAPRKIDNKDELIKPKDNNFCIQRPSGMGGSDNWR